MQRGRYLAAQQPRTMRSFHGRLGAGRTEETVEAIRRMTFSASLSTWFEVRDGLGLVHRRVAHFDVKEEPNVF